MIKIRSVELRGGFAVNCRIVRVPAYCLGDWAVHRQVGMPDLWGLTLLPLGLCLPPDWASFTGAPAAVSAMRQIARMRNDWAYVQQADLTPELGARLRAVTRGCGAVVGAPVGITADADAPIRRVTNLNGYARAS